MVDCIRLDHGCRDDRGIFGVVSLARCFPILFGQSLHQGRALEHQITGRCHDAFVRGFQVSYQSSGFVNLKTHVANRAIFLPIMVVTLPLPARVTQYYPEAMVSVLQWFAFWSFAGLLTIPWLFCVYQLVTKGLGRQKRLTFSLDETSAPKTVIVMPVYKEEPEVLVTAIDSVVDCDYPPSCIHVFLSFDGDQEDELYLKTIEKLGVPLTLESYPKSIDVTYRQARVTVSRFPHGGKRHCQKSTFKLIDKIYTEYLKRNDNLFILFIDSDCILDKFCIQNFMYEMVCSLHTTAVASPELWVWGYM